MNHSSSQNDLVHNANRSVGSKNTSVEMTNPSFVEDFAKPQNSSSTTATVSYIGDIDEEDKLKAVTTEDVTQGPDIIEIASIPVQMGNGACHPINKENDNDINDSNTQFDPGHANRLEGLHDGENNVVASIPPHVSESELIPASPSFTDLMVLDAVVELEVTSKGLDGAPNQCKNRYEVSPSTPRKKSFTDDDTTSGTFSENSVNTARIKPTTVCPASPLKKLPKIEWKSSSSSSNSNHALLSKVSLDVHDDAEKGRGRTYNCRRTDSHKQIRINAIQMEFVQKLKNERLRNGPFDRKTRHAIIKSVLLVLFFAFAVAMGFLLTPRDRHEPDSDPNHENDTMGPLTSSKNNSHSNMGEHSPLSSGNKHPGQSDISVSSNSTDSETRKDHHSSPNKNNHAVILTDASSNNTDATIEATASATDPYSKHDKKSLHLPFCQDGNETFFVHDVTSQYRGNRSCEWLQNIDPSGMKLILCNYDHLPINEICRKTCYGNIVNENVTARTCRIANRP